MFAIIEARKAGLLGRHHWIKNIISGVIVGIVALPLGMAFAIASGAKPEQGLYTSIIAGFIVSIFGGSRLQIAGPTGAFIAVLSGIAAEYGLDGLQIATCMAGFILLALGLCKMGAIVKFIPSPVILGFTSGIGVIIWVGQWKDFFGFPPISAEHFHSKLFQLLFSFSQLHLPTTLLGLSSLIIVIFSQKIPGLKRVPGPLTALVVGTLLHYTMGFDGVRTIGTAFGGIPQGMPELALPALSWEKIMKLIGPAFVIAMLGAIESLLSAVVADGMSGTKHDSNQELVGQGMANIITPLFGGIAATGAIARTATNIRNGGTGPLSGVFHSITLLVILILLAPLAVHIPLCTLAAILFVVAWNMSELDRFINMIRRAPIADIAILLITFTLTVFVDLVVAVNIGVILAMMQFMRRMAESVEVKQESASQLSEESSQRNLPQLPADSQVFAMDGPFFFGAVENFRRAMDHSHSTPKWVIIRLKWVPFIDISGIQVLEESIEKFQKAGAIVVLTGANSRVLGKLEKANLLGLIGLENYFSEFDTAVVEIRNRDSSI